MGMIPGGTGRQIYTKSAAFNLAGILEKRPNFLRSVLFGYVDNPPSKNKGLGRHLNEMLVNGPGFRLRNFHRWALNNYSYIGTPGEIKLSFETVIANDIAFALDSIEGRQGVTVQGIEVRGCDYSYWADQYMLENHNSITFNTDWSADYDAATNLITITFEDTTTESFTPTDFDPAATYVYAAYVINATEKLGIFIYRVGSGGDPYLDTIVDESVETESYFPVIPVRIDNEYLADGSQAKDLATKAFKKATGGKLSDVVDSIEDTDAVDDIDYAYIVFGASISSQLPAAKKYMFSFWEQHIDDPTEPYDLYESWVGEYDVARDAFDLYMEWQEAPSDGSNNPPDPQPEHTSAPSRPQKRINLRTPGQFDDNYDVRLEWTSITRETGTGLGKPDAEIGEVWWEEETDRPHDLALSQGSFAYLVDRSLNEVTLYRQVSANFWERLRITGLVQRTYVFGDHFEELEARTEIFAPEGDESAFIIPLRIDLFKAMSIRDQTDFAGSAAYANFHSYEIVIVHMFWQIVIMIAVMVISFAAMGPIAGAGGVLGNNMAVGVAIGLSGTTAAIVGAALNMLAAMLISKAILAGSKEIFGDKLGTLIGTLAAFATMNGLTNMAETGTFALNFGNLLSASSLLNLTSVLGETYTGYMAASTAEYQQKTQSLLEEYEQKSDEIEQLYADTFGYGNGIVDPYSLVDVNRIMVETPDSFLTRTLMTGSDIAEVSIEALYSFADLTTSTDLPLQ